MYANGPSQALRYGGLTALGPSLIRTGPADARVRCHLPAMTKLGLPDSIHDCLFDLDGVLTMTAKVHAAAWTQTFDAYLRDRAATTGQAYRPFDEITDYDEYVDGKPRYDGVRSFLASGGIQLAEGS